MLDTQTISKNGFLKIIMPAESTQSIRIEWFGDEKWELIF